MHVPPVAEESKNPCLHSVQRGPEPELHYRQFGKVGLHKGS